jgi:Holliday junction resolvase RusA-like endonuclease
MSKDNPDVYNFSVPGHPIGKEQHRKSKHVSFTKKGKPYHKRFTPQKTNAYKELIRICFLKLYNKMDDKESRWYLKLEIYYKGRCDYDKIANAVNDALSRFIWHDDAQIDSAVVFKYKITGTNQKEHILIFAERL